jgi:hypothetical protein
MVLVLVAASAVVGGAGLKGGRGACGACRVFGQEASGVKMIA